jgi:predicted lipid-binding transport protein (Tim44 family)
MLSAAAQPRRLAGAWRAPLSLGLGVPLLLGSTPAAAAGSAGIALGGVTTWLGMLAAVLALLAPRRPGDFAGAAAVVAVGVLFLAIAARRWRREHAPSGSDSAPGADAATAISLFAAARRSSSPAAPGVDGAAVLEAARSRFMHLQAAWDAGDVQALGRLTTPDMLDELLTILAHRIGGPSRTDVITLHAELLDVEELGASWLASVEFSGLIRESAEQGAVPFRELWMLAAAKEGAPSWRLARQQALL